MTSKDWVNLKPTKAVDICKLMEIDAETEKLLNDEQTPGQFIDVLVTEQNYSLAVDFLSYALPKREAIWWGIKCIGSVQDNKEIKVQSEAYESAERWVKNTSEDNRLACGVAAERSDYDNPSGLIAMASYFSSGSMAPPDYPPVEPPAELTPRMVSAALTLATIQSEPEKANEKYQLFFEQGLAVAKGVVKINS